MELDDSWVHFKLFLWGVPFLGRIITLGVRHLVGGTRSVVGFLKRFQGRNYLSKVGNRTDLSGQALEKILNG